MMLSTPEMEQLLAGFRRFDTDFEIEATITSSNEVYLRSALNRIHQPLYDDQSYVSIRVLKDGYTGEASANQIDPDTIEKLIQKAIQYAKLSTQPDTQIGFTPKSEMFQIGKAGNAAPAAIDLNQMTGYAQQVIDCAAESNLEAAGVLSCSNTRNGFFTSGGGHTITDHSCSRMNMMLHDRQEKKSGWASAVSASLAGLAIERLVSEAHKKATVPKLEKIIPAGKYQVILDFYACAEILSILSSNCFSAAEFHQDGRISASHLGEQLFHETVSLWDDGNNKSGCPTYSDYEGVPKQYVQLIENGKLTGAVYDRETAAKHGVQSTGHAQSRRQLFASGPQTNNLFMQAGSLSIDEMIQGVDAGLWITRFQYTTLSDPTELVISGTTRDGTFEIKHGKIQHALPNLKFRVSIYELLQEIQGLSTDVRLLETDFGVIQTPCWIVKQFNIL